jgi:hypothetical protein
MFIIFGWEKVVKPMDSILSTYCFHCKNKSTWSIWKETEWASLFFIRVFPFMTKYHISCDICGDSKALKEKKAKHALNPNKRTSALHDELVSMIENHQLQGLSEMQIEYRRMQRSNRNL